MEQEIPLILDRPAAVEYVSRLGTKLAGQLPEPRFDYTFTITASDPSNILHEPLALPGGYIYVPPSLFFAAQDEAEFAGMLAHAMAHISARHGTRQATGAELAKISNAPLILKSGIWTTAGFREIAEFLQFSEAYEREADELAVATISRGGYDPESIVRYFRRVWNNDSRVADSRDERIAGIENAIRKLTSPVISIPSDEFLRIKAQIAQPR
jgi:predicted Zn-dependent protease